jgi:hypothetical protein
LHVPDDSIDDFVQGAVRAHRCIISLYESVPLISFAADLHTEIAARLSTVGTQDHNGIAVAFTLNAQAHDVAAAEKKTSSAG